ncbi:MAG: preprotein translocase subunit SecE [Candidatus Omnitrophica bacterium]|nr:preprotein translocase subunit SecE [Candidatus Omnitrophota bacterium]
MNKLREFFKNVKAEMTKVSWPTREELFSSTAVVLVSVGILAGFIYVIDLLYTFVIGMVIK